MKWESRKHELSRSRLAFLKNGTRVFWALLGMRHPVIRGVQPGQCAVDTSRCWHCFRSSSHPFGHIQLRLANLSRQMSTSTEGGGGRGTFLPSDQLPPDQLTAAQLTAAQLCQLGSGPRPSYSGPRTADGRCGTRTSCTTRSTKHEARRSTKWFDARPPPYT
jgi:hypothetical protein